MIRVSLSFLLFLSVVVSVVLYPLSAHACGHDGIFIGGGYTQLFMYTPEHQLNARTSRRVNFGLGYGANAVVGYDFCGSRWGIQFPFEFARLKLNRSEWVNSFGSSAEAILHIKEWANGLDVHMVGGIGWTYLTEGRDYDRSKSVGITASLGPGFSYFFHRGESVSTAVALEVPFRFIYYFKDRLTRNGTSVIAFPIRLSVQVGF